MTTISKSFTAVGLSETLGVRAGENFSYSVSGTFVGGVVIEQQDNPDVPVWRTLLSLSAGATGFLKAEAPGKSMARVRVRCSAYTSGTIVTAIADQARPLRAVVGGGTFTTAGGDPTESIPVVGCVTGDTAVVWVQKAGGTPRTVDVAAAGAEAIAVTLSGDPSTDHVLGYLVLRAA